MKILVTGGAGFIGSNLVKKLLDNGDIVTIIDNFNDYYNESYKHKNIDTIDSRFFNVLSVDINNIHELENVFKNYKFDKIVHLAASVGVRNSLSNPSLHLKTNIDGTLNILEQARINKIKDIVFASSSSVYGNDTKLPSNEASVTDKPLNPYAMSKKSAELLCYTYHKLYDLNITILRFFTVYGPHGRPDMSPYIFTESILLGKQLIINGDGSATRDFTYVDDIVNGIIQSLKKPFSYEIINLGSSNPISVNNFVSLLEEILGKKANVLFDKRVIGESHNTYADITKAKKLLDFKVSTTLKEGLIKFANWYTKNRLLS